MKNDLIFTFITQVLVLICGLLVYRFAHQHLGNEGFAIYALCRRTHSFLFPALAIGCGVAIPRYIAFARVSSAEKSDGYFKAGMLLLCITTLMFILLVNIFPTAAAKLFFNDRSFSYLAFPISVLMIGYVLHSIGYAYYRGHSRMTHCNTLQIVNIALVPLLAANMTKSPDAMLNWTGAGWILIGSYVLLVEIRPKLAGSMTPQCLREMFVFGVQRTPSDFGFAALFGLPATLTAHISGAVAGGNVAFGISLLNMCGAVFAPIGLVLLPKASEAIARKDSMLLNRYLKFTLVGSAIVSFLMFCVFESAAVPILKLYLGKNLSSDLIATTKVVMLSAIPYTIYVASRSIIDTYFAVAINAINVILALALFLLLAFLPHILLQSVITPLMALVVALFFLAAATLVTCYYIMHSNKGMQRHNVC